MVIAKACGIVLVSAALALELGEKGANVLQRFREWCYAAKDKQGQKRRELEVSRCFAPVRKWLLSWWPADEARLALALDATTLKKRFPVLCVSVLYRGCAIPVAWKLVGAEEKGWWQPQWCGVLSHLAGVVPASWTVLVRKSIGACMRPGSISTVARWVGISSCASTHRAIFAR